VPPDEGQTKPARGLEMLATGAVNLFAMHRLGHFVMLLAARTGEFERVHFVPFFLTVNQANQANYLAGRLKMN
jgi:hypothetical protein